MITPYVYSTLYLLQPLLALVLYITKITSQIGGLAPGALMGYLFVAGGVLNKLREPLARLTVREQRLEGEFRYVNSRLITNRCVTRQF